MIGNERECILEEELLMVRHSGEIPEVALHASLHYLCEDREGPRFRLANEELRALQEAALQRYREIILRDLDLANRDRSLFRGINRALHNWYRFARFSTAIASPSEDFEAFRALAARALLTFLKQELSDVRAGARPPSINCSTEALVAFVHALGANPTSLPDDWHQLCEKGL